MNEKDISQEMWIQHTHGRKITLPIRLSAELLNSLESAQRFTKIPINTLLRAVIRKGIDEHLIKQYYRTYMKDGWMSEEEFDKIRRYVGDKYTRKVILDPKRKYRTMGIYKVNDEEDN